MKFRKNTLKTILSLTLVCSMPIIATSCGGNDTSKKAQDAVDQTQEKTESTPGACTAIDKSGDSALQAMIKTVVPQFKQLEYKDAETGKTMKYNLYSPKDADKSKKYPLVLFMADASTPGADVTAPLTQGYGALVWANAQSQAKNPCYVLVPQFTGVAVNDACEYTGEVDIVVRMLRSIVADKNVDADRIYTTGQAMGGTIAMYYNVAYPELFAASIFVDSPYDKAKFDSLVKHKFVYFIAGDKGAAYKCMEPLEEAARKVGVQYTYAEWSAKLPESRQSELAATMLEKGGPVNIFVFETGSVLPEDGKGCEQMYSFDYAYQNTAVRDWLFKQKK